MTAAQGPGAESGVPVLVGALCEREEALLLVRRGHGAAAGVWSLPNGSLHPGETLAEAVVRACAELTGLEVLCGPFTGWIEHPAADRPTIELCFEAVLADRLRSEPAALDASEVAEARFVPVWEISELRLDDGLAEFLADQGVIDTVV